MEDDFLAGYFNAVLLFGHSLKKFVVSQSPVSPLSLINEFRNTTFEGKKKYSPVQGSLNWWGERNLILHTLRISRFHTKLSPSLSMSFIPNHFSFYIIFTRMLSSVFNVQNYSEITWLSFNEVVSTFSSLQNHVGLGACSVGVGQLAVGWLILVNSLVSLTGFLALVGFCFVGHGLKITEFNH